MRSPVNRHRLWQVVVDAALVAAAWELAWRVKFDAGWPRYYDRYLDLTIVLLVVLLKLPVFAAFGLHNRWWRYVSTRDMWGVIRAVVVASAVVLGVFTFASIHPARVPRGIWVIDFLLTLALVAGVRLLTRTILERPRGSSIVARGKEAIVVGAGDAGQLLVKEMLRNPALGYTPIGLVDDDSRKKNLRLHGVRVLGVTSELPHIIHDRRPDEILIAIPSAPGGLRGRVVDAARAERIPVKTLPSLAELVAGDIDLAGQIRPVEVEDVLGREPVEVDVAAIAGYLRGETVLVTGAGGSIGSELCRQIARVGPGRLVLLDHAEPALFEIERELVDERHAAGIVAVIADVKDRDKMRQVFGEHRPAVIFHAAAYKHVAMMEANPIEAVRNNTLGTRVVAELAIEHDAKRFVLVSTDKAANAQTVMGQSKALCEWIVETHGHRDGIETRFVAVRFGNVLGSSGSVIPIFRRQIARGGPVTVTHQEMTRYFMTIPEAVQLVVQAGAIGGRGQVYVLDMGEPVRILDLAEKMIALSGKEPGVDIEIAIIGPKPGEKLHEELVGAGETVEPTSHVAILRLTRAPVDGAWLELELRELERLVDDGNTEELVTALGRAIREPTRAGPPMRPSAVTAQAE